MSVDKRHLLKSAYNYTQAGQWDRALDEYRKVTRLFPDDANIHSMIADLLAKKGDGPGACREHFEAARLFKAQGQEDKELQSLRKALRAQAGDAAASEAMRSHFTRAIQQAAQLMAAGKLSESEAVAQRLLDAEPGNLDANRLMDDLKAAQAAAQARQAMEEEAAVAPVPVADAAAEVIARLEGAVSGYLAADDFDNAIETMLVILKLDPGRSSVQIQLAQAQSQLMAKQAAQQKWQDLQKQNAAPVSTAKEVVQDVDLAAWRDEEEAVRKRLEEEQRIAEAAAHQELAIIETAVRELQAARAAAPQAATGDDAANLDDARLRALLAERGAAEQRLEEEKREAQRREAEAAQTRAKDAELLQHAIEMAKREAEAKAKAEALIEMEKRMAEEREAGRKQIEAERAAIQAREEALQTQMREMMRSEMERMQAEVKDQALKEIQAKLDEERRQRQSLETERTQALNVAEATAQRERDRMDAERRAAEEAARKERDAVGLLKKQEEERRRVFLAEAVKRRQARQGGGDQKAAVLKNSRRISDVLHAATTKHLTQDVEAMLETAKRYLKQDLLLDAMRICQTIAQSDPENEKVKALLKEIYERKGI
jgi:hypothetical protein